MIDRSHFESLSGDTAVITRRIGVQGADGYEAGDLHLVLVTKGSLQELETELKGYSAGYEGPSKRMYCAEPIDTVATGDGITITTKQGLTVNGAVESISYDDNSVVVDTGQTTDIASDPSALPPAPEGGILALSDAELPASVDAFVGIAYAQEGTTRKLKLGDIPNIEGPAGQDANIQVVTHGADATVARPSFDTVMWIGSVEPTNALENDIWIDSSL